MSKKSSESEVEPQKAAAEQSPVDRLMLRFIELKARKRELEALVKECSAEIATSEPVLLDWFATTGNTQVKNVLGTVFVVNDLFVGVKIEDGCDKERAEQELMELLEEHQIPGSIETKIKWAELRRRVKAAAAARSGKKGIAPEDVEDLDPEIMERLQVTPSTSLSVRLA
jgi:hypothetical protein